MSEKPQFSLPPKARPKLPGGVPLPPAKPVRLKTVSPAERRELEKYGWKDGDPVPANMADVIAEAQADLDYMPPPVDLKTPPLQMPDEVDFDKLPLSQQEKYQMVLESLNDAKFVAKQEEELKESMRLEADPTIKQAIAAAQGLGEQIELEAEVESPAVTTEELCTHCGWPHSIKDPVVVDDHDKTIFLQTLLGLRPFFKTYKVYNGNLQITLRSLSVEEYDLIFRQLEVDKAQGRTRNNIEQSEALTRYRLCLQVVEVNSKYRNEGVEQPLLCESLAEWKDRVKAPEGDDTVLRRIFEYFFAKIDTNESMHRLFTGLLMRFNALLNKLEVNADNADFYSAIN